MVQAHGITIAVEASHRSLSERDSRDCTATGWPWKPDRVIPVTFCVLRSLIPNGNLDGHSLRNRATLMTPTDPSFEQAKPADVDKLLPLIRAYYEFDGISFEPDRIEAALICLLRDASLGRVWIIRSPDAVGYVVLTFGFDLEFGGKVATVTEFYIVPEYCRIGLGTKAMHFIEKVCRELGIAFLELQVDRDNPEAQAFYKKLGFIFFDRIPLAKRLGE